MVHWWMDGWMDGRRESSPLLQKGQKQQQLLLLLRGTLHAWLATGGSLVDLKEQLCSFFFSFLFFSPLSLQLTALAEMGRVKCRKKT